MGFPVERPRRLRRTPAMRRLVSETRVAPSQLVMPLFVSIEADEPRPIGSMPGVTVHTRDGLRRAATDAVAAGVGGLMLFGIPARRDAEGLEATDPHGVLATAVRDVVGEVGDATVVMADLCLDEFTDHGHCGVLAADGSVDNDATLARYAEMSLVLADAGVELLGTSGMMDGQVRVVRAALDDVGWSQVGVLAYAAKYASAFYGPFREAVDSALVGDRRTYQQQPGNGREAMREIRLDVEEGADIVMVKPALAYLDVLAEAAATLDVPVWAYQVSGEYAMVEAAAERGWLDRDRTVDETLQCLVRAGAGAVLTYWAAEAAARWTRDGRPGEVGV